MCDSSSQHSVSTKTIATPVDPLTHGRSQEQSLSDVCPFYHFRCRSFTYLTPISQRSRWLGYLTCITRGRECNRRSKHRVHVLNCFLSFRNLACCSWAFGWSLRWLNGKFRSGTSQHWGWEDCVARHCQDWPNYQEEAVWKTRRYRRCVQACEGWQWKITLLGIGECLDVLAYEPSQTSTLDIRWWRSLS